MPSIESLLNPAPEIKSYPLASSTDTATFRVPRLKRQRLAKDAPIYHKGKIRGELRYPPCEERDEKLALIHEEFKIHPSGNIADFPRHIPYNSDKKSFQERTGREFFEVFQYTFKVPGDEKEWVVMWDYNIGLVRTTHLFKCNGYSKTTPGKMLNANPGLRDICHSITGGALAAQGYWMPYDAAKAVAATFCFKIRYALTPLFGLDFPGLCVHPLDRMSFGRMIIDPAIVRQSTETANYYRMLELRSSDLSAPLDPHPSTSSTERDGSSAPGFAARKQVFPHSRRKHADNLSTTTASTTSSGHGSSPDEYNSDSYCMSPISPFGSNFTPVNTPRSVDKAYSSAGTCTSAGIGADGSKIVGIPTPQEILASVSGRSAVASDDGIGPSSRLGKGVGMDDGMDDNYTETSSAGYSDVSSTASERLSLDLSDGKEEDYREFEDHGNSKTKESSINPPDANASKRKKMATLSSSRHGQTSILFAREAKAAHALLSLHMQDVSGSNFDEEGDGDGTMSASSLIGVHQWHQQGRGYCNQGRKRRRASA